MNYAGFWVRLLAALIDGVILYAVGILLGYILAALKLSGFATVLSLVISVYYWVFYQHQMGQTLGKKVMKLKVVDSGGKTPSIVTFALREILGKFVSAIILGIGYLMVAWDSKKQGLHDKIASTYVVKV